VTGRTSSREDGLDFASWWDGRLDDAKSLLRRNIVRAIKPPPPVNDVVPGRICLFAHYDRNGAIGPWTRHYLRTLHAAGFRTTVVSTAPHLQEQDVLAVAPYCDAIYIRSNRGYDFGSWRTALRSLHYPIATDATVLITNDSVLGPFFDLRPIVDQFEASGADVCGLTDNSEVRSHLQSYFLLIRGRCFSIGKFRRFWTGIRMKQDKWDIILRYEIGFTDLLRRLGLSWYAVFPLAAVADGQEWHPHPPGALNQTIFLWDALLRTYSFPFLKRVLIAKSVIGAPDVSAWPSVVDALPDLLPEARVLLAEQDRTPTQG
jgi:hypothetical protein